MARGKQTCKILKDIRRKIAEANDIEFITSECQFKGDCLGTCPKCEAELQYLNDQLSLRRAAGKAVVIAGLSVGLVSLGSCATKVDNTSPDSKVEDIEQCDELLTEPGEDWEMGEVVICDEDTANSDNEDTVLNESNGPVTAILVMGEDVFDEDSRFSDNECSAEDKIYSMAMVDVCPEFPGGTQAMYKWLKNNLKYSQEAVADSVEGKVIVEFVINENGKIENSHILRGKHPFLDKEAIRLVRMMPQWTPGEINGKKVKVSYTLPVTFKLPK